MSRLSDDLALTLQQHREVLVTAIQGIEPAPHRRTYAQVLLNRLLLLHGLQRSGWLGKGDDWYVQNLLGQSRDRCYRQTLKPLLYQGLGLPERERPLAIHSQFGSLPYLGSVLFAPHPLEADYPQLDLPDEPFEIILAWLAEQDWAWQTPEEEVPHILNPGRLAVAFEALINGQTGKPQGSTPEQLAELGDRSIHAYILAELQRRTGQAFASMDALEAALTDELGESLGQILPEITVLDPACGSGRFLLMTLHCLQRLYQRCLDQGCDLFPLQAQPHPPTPNLDWEIAHHIVTHSLYGVDIDPAAIDTTRTQLALALLATVPKAAPLPPLNVNLQVGNSLIGFIQVDEEGFDQVPPKKNAAPETALQGNLLQPLVAESYRAILTEKHLRTEDYRAQSQALAETGALPPALQGEFLRDRLEALDHAAQAKLNQLLLNQFSQALGIRIIFPKRQGRLRRRLLTQADIMALMPFHWGFHCHERFTQRDGFDVVIAQAPPGTFRANPDRFYEQYQAHFDALGIDLKTFKQNRQTLLRQQSILAEAWADYSGAISCSRQYFRRCSDYNPASAGTTQQALYLSTLFNQRCQRLTQPLGITILV
ncbi:MAG: DNA methyltransferase [Leptolyngbyaceae cyanobacterium]